ncbi:hypothetical protein ACFL1H_03440 [Nanoarchaeota archaeon]
MYFVLFNKFDEDENRATYENCIKICNRTIAKIFARNVMPAIYGVQSLNINKYNKRLKDPEKPYVVVVKHDGKNKVYGGYDDFEYINTFDVVRCNYEELENTIEDLAKGMHAKKVFAGLELKLL